MHLQQRSVEVLDASVPKITLQDWANSIQAAERTFATSQQQDQIENFLSKSAQRLRVRSETS
jgi:hypothetical protein